MFPVSGGFHDPPEVSSVLLDISFSTRGWTAVQQPQLRDQGLLLCTVNETRPPGPTFIVSSANYIVVFPQDTFWADMFDSP